HAPRGKPTVKKVVNSCGKNLSLIVAISSSGIIKFSSRLGAINHNIFRSFLGQLMRIFTDNRKKYLVMDNVRFYHSPEVKNVVARTSHEIMYLPTYSLFLNPAEKVFSKVKNLVAKHHLENYETLLGRIEDAFSMITAEDCNNWIEHSQSLFE
ncbi:19604_t:CDS:1, partial [Dentiscutata erythropus]